MKITHFFLGLFLLICGACTSSGFGEPIDITSDFTYDGENADVSIPANTFGKVMNFDFAEGADVDVSDLPSSYTQQSQPARLRFSDAQAAASNSGITITITLSDGAPADGLLALVRSSGVRVNEDGDIPANGEWRPVFGTQSGNTFSVTLYASAGFQSVVVVSANSAQAAVNVNASVSKKARLNKAVDAGLFARPWAVFCDRDNLPAAFQASCAEATMGGFADKLVDAAQFIESINFANMRVNNNSYEFYQQTYGDDFIFSSDDAPADKTHNFAVVTNASLCGGEIYGCFDPETLIVYFTSAMFDAAQQDAVGVHELMHAAQYGTMGDGTWSLGDISWILEGTATYVAQGYDPGAADYGDRNWSTPLRQADDNLTPYQTNDFFADTLPDVGFLFAFLNGMQNGADSYALADDGFGSIGELFTIKFSDFQQDLLPAGKIICGEELNANDIQGTTNEVLLPMSSSCAQFSTVQNDKCVEIEANFDPANQTLLLDGVAIEDNVAVTSTSEDATLQLISFNTSVADSAASIIPVKFRQTSCDDSLVGLWCSSIIDYQYDAEGADEESGNCTEYSDYVRIFENNNGTLKAVPFLGFCEDETDVSTTITENGDVLSFNFAAGAFSSGQGCDEDPFEFALTHSGTQLTGSYQGEDPDLGVYEVTETFQKTSNDPCAPVAFTQDLGDFEMLCE